MELVGEADERRLAAAPRAGRAGRRVDGRREALAVERDALSVEGGVDAPFVHAGVLSAGEDGYALTARGRELGELLLPLDAWSRRWARERG